MPSAARARTPALTRRGALLSGVVLLSGCSVRLERGSSLPGPKATLPSDVAALTWVRQQLLGIIAAASAAGGHPAQAAGAATLHRRQLVRLDATLKGLGASPPPSATPTPGHLSWPTAEAGWLTPTALHTLTTISQVSRPLAMSIAATGLSAADDSGSPATFTSSGTFPAAAAAPALTATQAAIEALEWIVARADPQKRGSMPDALGWLTSVRATIEASAATAAAGSRAPVRTYANAAAAQGVAVTALRDLLATCADAARSATTPETVTEVLYIWSKTLRELSRLGSPDLGTLPGLAA